MTGLAALKGMMIGGMSMMMLWMQKGKGGGGPWQSSGPWQGGGGKNSYVYCYENLIIRGIQLIKQL